MNSKDESNDDPAWAVRLILSWNSDPAIRAEFGSFARYAAHDEAVASWNSDPAIRAKFESIARYVAYEEAVANWNSDAAIRAEFWDFKNYAAYCDGVAAGVIQPPAPRRRS